MYIYATVRGTPGYHDDCNGQVGRGRRGFTGTAAAWLVAKRAVLVQLWHATYAQPPHLVLLWPREATWGAYHGKEEESVPFDSIHRDTQSGEHHL